MPKIGTMPANALQWLLAVLFYMAMQGDIIERYEVLNYFRQHTQKVTVKAENNGGGSEDIEIVRIMEEHLTHLSRYKRCIRRGMLYNRIAKLSTTEQVKLQLWGNSSGRN